MKARKFNSGGELKNDETQLAPFSKLSPARQAELRSSAKKRLVEAESNRKRPLSDRFLEAAGEFMAPENVNKARREAASVDAARRESNYNSAKRNADELESPTSRTRYGDDKPHKMNPNEPAFKKGGGVKKYAKGGSIDGIAQRGKTRGRMR